MGLQFSGQLISTGSEFRIRDLPRPAVLLENAGRTRVSASRGRYSFEELWVLWRFDFDSERWVEVVRVTARDSSWALDVAPVAHRLLHPCPAPAAALRASPVAERLTLIVAGEIEKLERELRCHVLAELDQFVARAIIAASAELAIRPQPSGDGGVMYARIGAHAGEPIGEFLPRRHF